MISIKDWLSQGQFREVNITTHCHGVRVTIRDHFDEITSCVESTIENAFNNCLIQYPEAIKHIKLNKLKNLEHQLIGYNQTVNNCKAEITKLKNEFK
jgi:hypothetical protein